MELFNEMMVIRDDNVAYFDVDDTLILWDREPFPDEKDTVMISGRLFKINRPMVDVLEKHINIGHSIVVWSQGGYEWALKVVMALELNHVVDLIMCKPKWYYDDLECTEWMPKRVYKRR